MAPHRNTKLAWIVVVAALSLPSIVWGATGPATPAPSPSALPPTMRPTPSPSAAPSPLPSIAPMPTPTATPLPRPTATPLARPTAEAECANKYKVLVLSLAVRLRPNPVSQVVRKYALGDVLYAIPARDAGTSGQWYAVIDPTITTSLTVIGYVSKASIIPAPRMHATGVSLPRESDNPQLCFGGRG